VLIVQLSSSLNATDMVWIFIIIIARDIAVQSYGSLITTQAIAHLLEDEELVVLAPGIPISSTRASHSYAILLTITSLVSVYSRRAS
jgi:hypothetical protein